jgi:transcriptional antiterminator NusG
MEEKNMTDNTIAQDLANDMPPELKVAGNQRRDSEARWYVLHTFNGYEAVAEDNLKKVIEKYHLEDRVLEIYIPTEDIMTEKKDGTKMIKSQHSMPTYIFVKMIYGDDIWHTITRTRGITGFVGPKGRPLPLSNADVMKMRLERKVNAKVAFEVDDVVTIMDGPLMGQTAKITNVDAANHKITVVVNMFGRSNKVELHTSQVKALEN